MAVIEEVLLGGAVGALIEAIFVAKEKATFFKKTLEHLESTLEAISPIMDQLIKSEQVHGDVFNMFIQQLEKARVLVDMYYDINMWKLLKKWKVKKVIKQMDASLQRIVAQDFQVKQLLYVVEINNKMDHIITLLKGNKDTASAPAPATLDEFLSSPKNDTSYADKPSGPTFELLWKMSKNKCVHIRFWRSSQE